MNEFSSAKVSLSDPAAKNVTTVTLTLPSNEIVIDNRTNFNHMSSLKDMTVLSLCEDFLNHSSANIKLSKT